MSRPPRLRSSLRLRIVLTTLVLLALALALAAFAFERVARDVVSEAIHSHLTARAKEVQESVARFQRERALTVRNWAEAEAMQLTLDSGDPKFAEDHIRRTIQDQKGSVLAAALLDLDERVVALVRYAQGELRGDVLPELRGSFVDVAQLRRGTAEDETSVSLAAIESLLRGGAEAGETVFMTAPVKDFADDLVGWIVAVLSTDAVPALLEEVAGDDGTYVPVVADRERRVVLTPSLVTRDEVRPVLQAPLTSVEGALERVERGPAGAVLAVRTVASTVAPGWSTHMFVDEAVASGRLAALRVSMFVLFCMVLAGAAVVAVISLRQAARPLTDVAGSMERVAGGDLSTRVRAEYSGELGRLVSTFNTMVEEVARSRDELQRTEALRREVEIAHQIQTAILPVSPAVPGFEIAARMKPADDVGGDLYDVLAFGDTYWVLVGDVSGHGINSGLVMMMAQSAAYAAIADDPHCSPSAVIAAVNRVIHENVRRRMRRDDYLTLMAARHMGDGQFLAAGMHQPIFLARGRGEVDVMESQGPWLGLAASVEPPPVPEYEFRLAPGDVAVFVTDGILEAKDATEELYGEDRVRAVLESSELASASQVLALVFAEAEKHSHVQTDDMTAVVLRRKNDPA